MLGSWGSHHIYRYPAVRSVNEGVKRIHPKLSFQIVNMVSAMRARMKIWKSCKVHKLQLIFVVIITPLMSQWRHHTISYDFHSLKYLLLSFCQII